jgi:hypothetical protein
LERKLWDLYNTRVHPGEKISPAEAEKLWAELGGDDAPRAYRAILRLAAAGAESSAG